jgi:hypothetical protein
VGAIACGAIIACSFSKNEQHPPVVDGAVVDMQPPPDGGPCAMPSTECVGDMLRTCSAAGAMYEDTACAWGCGSAHCLQIVPAGGAVTPDDVGLGSDALLDISMMDNTVINTDNGTIIVGATIVRSMGQGVIAGIDYEQRGTNAAVFRMKSLATTGRTYVRGHRAVAIVADETIEIGGVVDARGTCTGSGAGPGGFSGGGKGDNGGGDGGGLGSAGQDEGGGGGGYGGAGGNGGNGNDPTSPILGGSASGDATITLLAGGAGGGGGGNGGGGATGVGGGGGGAVQLVSNLRITVGSDGGINAGGCGGRSGAGGNDGGGGGGAGGTILLEAPSVQLLGALAVNGGGGGGGSTGGVTPPPPGGNATLNRNPAQGAPGGAIGGIGGAANMLDGTAGGTTGGNGAGGGGAVGRIRINTKTGSASVDAAAVLSPSLDDHPTSCTQGTATLQ